MASVKQRLETSAIKFFRDKGYERTTTRDICSDAKTSLSAITKYFGSKEDLLKAVLANFNEQVLIRPSRVLTGEVDTKDRFQTRLEIFFLQTLEGMCAQHDLVVIASQIPGELTRLLDVKEYHRSIVDFLQKGQNAGLVSRNINIELISGIFMGRILCQLLASQQLEAAFGVNIHDPEYQTKWSAATTTLILNGLLSRE